MSKNEFGELHMMEGGKTKVFPTYCCGHCSNVVVLNPNRTRDRKTCYGCGKWLCEQNQLCQAQCTPIHSMAKDHFENAGEWGKLVPAIMGGCTSVEEAEQKGLILG